MAKIGYITASGQQLDDKRSEPFSKQLDEVYRNPFKEAKKPMGAQETIEYVMGRIKRLAEMEQGG